MTCDVEDVRIAEGVVSAFRATVVSHRTRRVIATCVTWRLTFDEAQEDARVMIYVTNDPIMFEARVVHGLVSVRSMEEIR